MVFQNWNINHDASVLLSIRQAANSQRETAGKKCTCQNNQSYLGLTQLHDSAQGVITCQSHLAFVIHSVHLLLNAILRLSSSVRHSMYSKCCLGNDKFNPHWLMW